MISFIRGTVADLTENSAIIESNCIGFEINMTGNALAQLHIGQEVKLHTYFQVREDAMVLYGFFNKDDLEKIYKKEESVFSVIYDKYIALKNEID